MANPALTQIASNTTLAITELQNVATTVQVSITPTAGDLVIWAGSPAALGDFAGAATGNVLLSAGAATPPTWGQVNTATIATSAVTYAKIQNEATVTLLGNPTGAPAAPSEVSLGTGLSFAGSVLNATAQTLVLLNTLTPSNVGSVQDTTSLTNTYFSYLITWSNVIPVSATFFVMQFQVSSTFQTTGYLASSGGASSTGTFAGSGITTGIPLSSATVFNGAPGSSGNLVINNPSAAAIIQCSGTCVNATAATTSFSGSLGGYFNTSGAVTGVKFLFNTGNITSGTIKIYGILG